MKKKEWGISGLLLLSSIFSLWYLGVFYFEGGTVDDTYIVYRYVENLVNGDGFRWNPGGDKVQGFTSMGWVSILALSRFIIDQKIHTYAPYVGLLFGSISLIVTFWAAKRMLKKKYSVFAFTVPLSLSLSPVYVRHCISGMETSMVFLTTSIVSLVCTIKKGKKSFGVSMALVTILSGLTRPDLVIMPAIAFTSVELYKADNAYDFVKSTYVYYLLSAFLGAAYLVWKYSYFGSLLPLPAYMKANPTRLNSFTSFIFSWQLRYLSYVSLPAFLFLLSAYPSGKKNFIVRWSSSQIGVSATIISFLAYLSTVVPIMNYHYRYQSATIVPLFLMSVVGIESLFIGAKKRIAAKKYVLSLMVSLLILHNIGMFTIVRNQAEERHNNKERQVKMGKMLRSMDGITVAGSQAGRLPYFSRVKHIDILGLNNKFVATNRYDNVKFEEMFAQYISERKPEIYMGYRKDDYTDITDDKLYNDYEKVCEGKYKVLVLKESIKRGEIKNRVSKLEDCMQ